MLNFFKKTVSLISLIGWVSFYVSAQPQKLPHTNRYKLWYKQAAQSWNEALPIGNGFTGGMICGNPELEKVQLNGATIWGGGPNNTVDSAAKPYLAEVRVLLTQKRYAEAQAVANRSFGPKGNSGMPYQLAGNLLISFPVHLQTSDYYRDLDLANATATVKYTSNGVKYKREFFTSLGENNVLMVRLTADKPKMITCKVKLQSPLTHEIKVDNRNLILSGKGSDHENRKGQIRYNIAARVKISQGASKVDTSGIAITCADTAVLYLSIATNFVNYHDISADPLQRASAMLNVAYEKGFDQLLSSHIKFYRAYFDRVKFNLEVSEASKGLKKAIGTNSNLFYRATEIKTPVIKESSKDLSVHLPQNWLYDLATQPGKSYKII